MRTNKRSHTQRHQVGAGQGCSKASMLLIPSLTTSQDSIRHSTGIKVFVLCNFEGVGPAFMGREKMGAVHRLFDQFVLKYETGENLKIWWEFFSRIFSCDVPWIVQNRVLTLSMPKLKINRRHFGVHIGTLPKIVHFLEIQRRFQNPVFSEFSTTTFEEKIFSLWDDVIVGTSDSIQWCRK